LFQKAFQYRYWLVKRVNKNGVTYEPGFGRGWSAVSKWQGFQCITSVKKNVYQLKSPAAMRGFYGLQFFLLCFFVRFTWGTEAILGFHRTVLTVIGFYLVFQVLVKGFSDAGSSVF